MKKLILTVFLISLIAITVNAEFLHFKNNNSLKGNMSCGDTIYENTILENDILGCEEKGIIIGANNITLDCNGHMIQGGNSSGGYFLGIYNHKKEGVTIKNCFVKNFTVGINIDQYAKENKIYNNTLVNNYYGMHIEDMSDYNYIGNNKIINNKAGIFIDNSMGHSITNNIIESNELGVSLQGINGSPANNNLFWNNKFINNNLSALEEGYANNNYWNLSNIGNYWSDFLINPGFPDYYEISGDGNGVDFHPTFSIKKDYILGKIKT